MPVPDFETYKVAANELSSATKFNNLVQAIEDEFGDIDGDQIAGFPNNSALFLRGDGTWAAPASSVGYGTSLPGSPVDGQEHILVDNVDTPTYAWRFRWNAGSDHTDKWEFIGGSPALVEVATAEGTASTTYVALTTAVQFTLPRAGVYEIEHWAHVANSTNFQNSAQTVKLGAAAAADAEAWSMMNPQTGNPDPAFWGGRRSGLAASAVLALNYKVSGGTGTFSKRALKVTPVRVS